MYKVLKKIRKWIIFDRTHLTYNKLLPLLLKFRDSNEIYLNNGGSIGENTYIKKSRIAGAVTIGNNCRIINCNLFGNISIGSFTSINGPETDLHAHLSCIKIGKFCSIAKNVAIQEYNHNHKRITSYFINKNIFHEDLKIDIDSKGEVIIGNDVWIGTQCVILSGVNIGDGSVIGANSVVTGNIPPYAIAFGSPAKIVGYRFEDSIINKLEEIKWWDWPLERIKKNKPLFENELTMEVLDSIQ